MCNNQESPFNPKRGPELAEARLMARRDWEDIAGKEKAERKNCREAEFKKQAYLHSGAGPTLGTLRGTPDQGSIPDEIIKSLADMDGYAASLVEDVKTKLDRVTLNIKDPDYKDSTEVALEYPPLFHTIREHVQSISLSLHKIKRLIDRAQL